MGYKRKRPTGPEIRKCKKRRKDLKKEQKIIKKKEMTVCRYAEIFKVQQRNKELILRYSIR